MIGSRLAHFEIAAKLGEGGMGVVYLAHDNRLGREVAIKVLPEAFVADQDRLARFEREARVLASLSHPNVAAIYEVGEQVGTHFLVMELAAGEDLSERLARGPVPIHEALAIALQIAEALEAAHERGIVHRDLKPANIKVNAAGQVKVLDFGLAKALEPESAEPSHSALAASPTLTNRATQAGVLLGTAAYMSPEQARGKPADKRADIWAFGVVLWEMLTGRRLFAGETLSDVLAGILKTEPDWTAVPAGTPARVRTLLRRCLEHDAQLRLRDIGEARIALDRPGDAEEAGAERSALAPPWRGLLPWALVVVLTIAAGVASWNAIESKAVLPAPVRVTIAMTEDASVRLADRAMGASVVIAPAGDRLAFVARGDGAPIYVRRLDSLVAAPIPGTEGGQSPFFSPDGEWIGFFADGKLKKAALSGGAATTLADAAEPRGGTWLEDGTIVFAPRVESPLLQVPANGGTPTAKTTLEEGSEQLTHRWPEGLPGGRGLLYTAHTKTGSYDDASLVVLGPGGAAPRVLLQGGYHGRYLASGHIAYLHDQTLFAVPFDLDRLERVGPAVPVIQGVAGATLNGTAEFSAAHNGLLIYGTAVASPRALSWLDASGRLTPLRDEPASYRALRLSPTGDRAALAIEHEGRSDIWILDLARENLSRMTFHNDNDVEPVWTPNGRRIAYTSWREDVGALNFFWQRADGTGQPQRLTTSSERHLRGAWHPDGAIFAYTAVRQGTLLDVMLLALEGDEASGFRPGTPEPFLATPAEERDPHFSPDGRWLAYASSESGNYEVYVRPFPGPGGKWQISNGSGVSPRWSPTRPELLYRAGNHLMVVEYGADERSFRAGRPRPWAELPPETQDFDWSP
ncbi:MAG TPA: protein kinase, partial [Vicinamibacterales bacterium]|nr:protein kinase [Vicinamibacterales bacterium]